MVNNWSFKNKW